MKYRKIIMKKYQTAAALLCGVLLASVTAGGVEKTIGAGQIQLQSEAEICVITGNHVAEYTEV